MIQKVSKCRYDRGKLILFLNLDLIGLTHNCAGLNLFLEFRMLRLEIDIKDKVFEVNILIRVLYLLFVEE